MLMNLIILRMKMNLKGMNSRANQSLPRRNHQKFQLFRFGFNISSKNPKGD